MDDRDVLVEPLLLLMSEFTEIATQNPAYVQIALCTNGSRCCADYRACRLKFTMDGETDMTDHMVEERIRKSLETTRAKFSTEEVVHLAFCDECSRLVAAMFRECRQTADVHVKGYTNGFSNFSSTE